MSENSGQHQGGRFQRGQSGNPSGKPKGARHKTTLLAEKLMQDDAEKIVKAVIDATQKGDMTAARIVLDRIAPARRDNPVSFELPKIENAADAAKGMSAILDAVAAGDMTPSEANEVSRLAGVPAIAGAVAGNDPALAAIAEYERRRAIADASWEASTDVYEALQAERKVIGVVTFKGEEVHSLERLDVLAEQPRRVMSKDELEDTIAQLPNGWAIQQAEAAFPDPEYQAARAAIEANLPAYRRAEANIRHDDTEETASENEREASDAQIAMFETTPTPPAGAAALIRHAMDHLDEIGINDVLLEDVFTDAIRNAVAVPVLERGEA